MSVNLVTSTGPQKTTLNVVFSLTTTQSPGTLVQGSISAFGPLVGASTTIFIPVTEVWHIVDIYIVGTPVASDGIILMVVNGYIQNMQPTLSQINLNLLTRFRLTHSLPLAPASSFAVSLSLLGTPSANATQTVYIAVIRSPFEGEGAA